MTRISLLSAIFLLLSFVMASVTSFHFKSNGPREFGKSDFYNGKYQYWMGKRGLGQASSWGFGRPVGDSNRYFNWKDFVAKAMVKRQLSFGPRSFGNYRSYFTDGLQDWKNTFRGTRKRDAMAGDEDVMV